LIILGELEQRILSLNAGNPASISAANQYSCRPTAPDSTGNSGSIIWRVACLQTHGLATLHHITVHEGDSGARVMGILRHEFMKINLVRLLNIIFLFRVQALLEASVRPISFSDVEAHHSRIQVGVEHIELSSILTEAFHYPAILTSSRDFVTSHQRYALSTGTNANDPICVLLVGWTTRKEYFAYFIAAVILFSVAAGICVGVLLHNVGLGVAVSSGLATVLSCVEGLVFWQFYQRDQ